MSNIDKQALREAAEKATKGQWQLAIYNSCRLECEVKFKDACAAAGIKLQIDGE